MYVTDEEAVERTKNICMIWTLNNTRRAGEDQNWNVKCDLFHFCFFLKCIFSCSAGVLKYSQSPIIRICPFWIKKKIWTGDYSMSCVLRWYNGNKQNVTLLSTNYSYWTRLQHVEKKNWNIATVDEESQTDSRWVPNSVVKHHKEIIPELTRWITSSFPTWCLGVTSALFTVSLTWSQQTES